MNIALIGYGRMGHEIESVAIDRGHTITLTIDVDNRGDLNAENLANVDVAIEFSSPDAARDNITSCLTHSTPVVSGTTGWLEHWDEVEQLCKEYGAGLFYASNFSIGVNLLFEINKRLAGLMSSFPGYDVSILEKHHVHKLDAPSGTAISLAEQIIGHHQEKTGWSLDSGDDSTIPVEAIREGEIKGIHHVRYESDVDILTISHEAKSRRAFASGAVLAAEFLKDRKGMYGMKDLLKL